MKPAASRFSARRISCHILPMPPFLARHLTPQRRALAAQFLRFGVVGVFGFLVDTATVYATRGALGLYAAGAAGYLVAVSGNWAINRAWTFRGHGEGTLLRQWALYLVANLGGLALNRGAFFALVTLSATCAAHPVLAIAAGSVSGMFANFHFARVVFAVKRAAGTG
jgi:putative flippase GtrA